MKILIIFEYYPLHVNQSQPLSFYENDYLYPLNTNILPVGDAHDYFIFHINASL